LNKYEKSLKFQLIYSLIFILLSLSQIVISWGRGSAVLVIFFSIMLIAFAGFAILISLDMILKDDLKIKGKIVYIDGSIISIIRADGKFRRVRIPTSEELERYALDQEVELVIARRTGILHAILQYEQ